MNKDTIKDAIGSARSKKQAIQLLGWRPNGASYKKLSRFITENQIDISHFLNSGQITNLRLRN